MDPVENPVEVAPSEDQGNVPIGEVSVSPSQPTEPAPAPAEPTEPAATAEATPELYELPDGRKVDAATLATEWRENFMPDYTKKSQDLATIRGTTQPQPVTQPNQPANPLDDPDYVPKTYGELVDHIKKGIFSEIEGREKAAADAHTALENQVSEQLTEVKKSDPSVNETALFLHATKYHFADLRLAYQNMKDMGLAVKKAVTTTSQNIAKKNDPVSVQPGATGGQSSPGNFSSAVDYLRSLKS